VTTIRTDRVGYMIYTREKREINTYITRCTFKHLMTNAA